MTYRQRSEAEKKWISDGVDSFLAKRLSPTCPVKIAAREQSKLILREYYRRKDAR